LPFKIVKREMVKFLALNSKLICRMKEGIFMFRNMRRSDKAITEKEALDLLAKGEYGILSTVGENGYAYGVPLSYCFRDGNIYFHAATEGLKIDNILFNNKVCFTVVGNTKLLPEQFSTNYESVIAFGKASIVEADEKMQGLKFIIEKYSPEFLQSGLEYIERAHSATKVMKIEVEKITGKAGRK